jgi:hypothetical protein
MKWTITSKSGQVLYGETADNQNMINMSSKMGNHGQIERSKWDVKVKQMQAAGYSVEIK